MARLVLKFGGTSVGAIDRIKNVARRVKAVYDAGNEVAVVVSQNRSRRLKPRVMLVLDANRQPFAKSGWFVAINVRQHAELATKYESQKCPTQN